MLVDFGPLGLFPNQDLRSTCDPANQRSHPIWLQTYTRMMGVIPGPIHYPSQPPPSPIGISVLLWESTSQRSGSIFHPPLPFKLLINNNNVITTIGTHQEQTQRYITHTTTNTQLAFGSVLIKGRIKFKRSRNVLWLIQDRLFQIEFAFNYWNISTYLLNKWIYYCETIMLRNNSVNYFKFCPAFDKDCLHFRKCDASVPAPWRVSIIAPSISDQKVVSEKNRVGHIIQSQINK